MPTGYQIKDQDRLYYVTLQIVEWVDVFTRKRYRDIIVDALNYCSRHKQLEIYGYVIMSNHFHLALETPEGNLAAGMQWLQATFTNRYNRFRGKAGHGSIFQGRYKALVCRRARHWACCATTSTSIRCGRELCRWRAWVNGAGPAIAGCRRKPNGRGGCVLKRP